MLPRAGGWHRTCISDQRARLLLSSQAKLESLDASIVQRAEGGPAAELETPATTQSRRKVLTCVVLRPLPDG